MSHRGRRMQTSASREADCAVPCSWTQSSETRDGWINTMRKPACSQLLPLQCWNSNTVWAQSYECEEDITTADFNIGKGYSAPQNCPSFFSFQRRERRDASIFPAMEGKITLLLYNTHCLQSLLPNKIQTSKTEHKIAISARDIKQHKLCHVAITHTLSSVTRATVDAATDAAFRKKSTGRQDWIFCYSKTEKDLEHSRWQMATVEALLPSPG